MQKFKKHSLFLTLLIVFLTGCSQPATLAPPIPPPATELPPTPVATETAVSYPAPLPTATEMATAVVTPYPTLLPTEEPYPVATWDPSSMPTAVVVPFLQLPKTVMDTAVPNYTYEIVNAYPHDPNAFTQGLIYEGGILYEGTGLNGKSTLRETDLETGQIVRELKLADSYFGEGITIFDDRLYQLTWRDGTGFIYNKDNFELLDTWNYTTEGWGITHDGQKLIMSDGTNVLHFLDPDSLVEIGRVEVTDSQQRPVYLLNELEYVNGEILANVWRTQVIVRINPDTGDVIGWINLEGLLDLTAVTQEWDVLNGIAYDEENDRLFVTGKWWPELYEIDLIQIN